MHVKRSFVARKLILFYLSIALINIEKAYPKKIMENDMQTIMNTFEQRMTILYNC